MHPIIGIVICGIENNRQFVSCSYIEAIEDAGAVPVIIPRILNDSLIPYYISVCHGFLFCGGDDICPLLFSEDLKAFRGHTDITTDYFQLRLMKQALFCSSPVLGICRGMQLLNVALGGTLWQDISLRPAASQNHMQFSSSRSEPCHKVTFKYNSMLHKICGNSLNTNSFHHQCIKTTGASLHVTGTASDGIIEAIEDDSRPFCIGVQWHPECMYHSCQEMYDLFAAFIASTKMQNLK